MSEGDCPECAELRAENARLRARLAEATASDTPLGMWVAGHRAQTGGTWGVDYPLNRFQKTAVAHVLARDQFDRNCRASVGMSAPLDDHGEGEG